VFRAKIYITLKKGVLDPAGQAVRAGLHSLGYTGVAEVRMAKSVEVMVEANSAEGAEVLVREICERVLANPVMEEYSFVLEALA